MNPRLVGLVVRGVEIRGIEDLEQFIKDNEVQIAALTIPKSKAPEIADRLVKAGIKDLTKADVSQDEDTIIIKLPDVEITGIEIDNDSFEKLDESNNIFNPITVEDLNDAQKDLKDKMEAQAIEKGILDIARENAETVISGMLSDYDVQIEWK